VLGRHFLPNPLSLPVMKYALLPLLLLVASCGADQQSAQTVSKPVTAPAKVEPVDTTPIDYSRLKENLPGSQYYFPVRVFDVKFQTVKKAFEQRKDAYSVPTAVSGKRLSFGFEMTNPYSEPMSAPIPDYFRLQAACFDLGEHGGQTYTSYNRTSHVYELGAGDVTTTKGGKLYEVPGYERGAYDRPQLPFKPHQTRRFKVVFEHPITTDCSSVTLLGFTKSDQNAGEQIYTGLVLDVASNRIVDQLYKKRSEAFVPTK
jgi:hypothetical protein